MAEQPIKLGEFTAVSESALDVAIQNADDPQAAEVTWAAFTRTDELAAKKLAAEARRSETLHLTPEEASLRMATIMVGALDNSKSNTSIESVDALIESIGLEPELPPAA